MYVYNDGRMAINAQGAISYFVCGISSGRQRKMRFRLEIGGNGDHRIIWGST